MGIGEKFKARQKNHGSAAVEPRLNRGSVGGNFVCQNNKLVRANYKLRLDEQRLVLIAIGKVDSRVDDIDDFSIGKLKGFLPQDEGIDGIKITAEEWARAFKISPKNSFTQLKKAARSLWSREITRISGECRDDLRWVWKKSEVIHADGGGKVILYFSPGLLYYLKNLTGGFTRYRLSQIAGFRRVYSIRIFQLCAQFRGTGKVKVGLQDFHEILQTPPSYQGRQSDLERFVLLPAVAELKAKCAELAALEWKIIDGRLVEFSFPPHSMPPS